MNERNVSKKNIFSEWWVMQYYDVENLAFLYLNLNYACHFNICNYTTKFIFN